MQKKRKRLSILNSGMVKKYTKIGKENNERRRLRDLQRMFTIQKLANIDPKRSDIRTPVNAAVPSARFLFFAGSFSQDNGDAETLN